MDSTDGRGEQGFRAQPQGRGRVFGRLAPGFLPSRELSATSVLSVPRMSIPPEITAARSLCACPLPSALPYHWSCTSMQAVLRKGLDIMGGGVNWSPCEVPLGEAELRNCRQRDEGGAQLCFIFWLSATLGSLEGEMPAHYRHGYQPTH